MGLNMNMLTSLNAEAVGGLRVDGPAPERLSFTSRRLSFTSIRIPRQTQQDLRPRARNLDRSNGKEFC